MAQIKNVVTALPGQITVIDPRVPDRQKLRVAAYARVSSDSEDQLNSYLAQVDFYSKYIASQEGWELADIYADEGLSGLEARNRDEFSRMIADCKAGKIDRILCKSISRFARNTKEYVHFVRELLRLGISVEFAKENIDTGRMSSEQVSTIYGAFAQMESTNHSSNMQISNRIRMEKGLYTVPTTPYGYQLINKKLVIVPKEAEVVRYIFQSYLNGMGKGVIAEALNLKGVSRRRNREKWIPSTIHYILTNISYTGNMIWQKTYTPNSFPLRSVLNRGERPKYYVQNSHATIIDMKDFQKVQRLLAEKREHYYVSGRHDRSIYQKHIFCDECGAMCRRKITNGKSYWVCHQHDTLKGKCPVPQIPETEISAAILRMYHKLQQYSDHILRPMLKNLNEVREMELRSNRRLADIDKEIAQISEQNLVLTRLKSKGIVDPALYLSQLDELERKVRDLRRLRRKVLEASGDDSQIRATGSILEYLEDAPSWREEPDSEWFDTLIDRIILLSGEQVQIRLINGLQLTEPVGKAVG